MITRRIMFLLIHLALCAVEVMVLVVPILPEGNVTIVRVAAEETRDGNSSSMHPRSYIYTVAVVHVDLGFNYIHEGDDATGGLTRLICGTRVFESHDLFESSQDDVTFPRHMVTYEDSHMYLPTSMAKFLFKSSDSTLTTFLVLDAVKTSRMEVLGTPTRHENFQDQAYELDQCILKILHPSQQTVGPPRIIRRTHDSKLVWGQSFLRLRAFSVNDDDDGGEDDDNEGTRAHKLVSDTIHKVKMKRIQRGACAAHPNVSPKFIEMMASAKNPLMSLMQDMLPTSPFELMGTLIATAVTSGLAGSDAETISYVLSQQYVPSLTHSLTYLLTYSHTYTLQNQEGSDVRFDVKTRAKFNRSAKFDNRRHSHRNDYIGNSTASLIYGNCECC